MTIAFPDGFTWGAATSAYQTEGAATEDGRGPSIWDTFCRVAGRTHHGDTGDIACDSYHRVEEDLDLVSWLGLSAYRFSISWSRILPSGHGPVNQPGLDHYRRVLDGLHERGVTPFVTLYHWDLPQGLQDRGGWAARDTAYRFADYALLLRERLGDLVPRWITLNEPGGVAFGGHLEGRVAPGIQNLPTALAAAHHLLLGHGLAVQALSGGSAQVGITLSVTDVRPAPSTSSVRSALSTSSVRSAPSTLDVLAARRIDGKENRWFLDPLLLGAYPSDVTDWVDRLDGLDVVRPGDLALIHAPLDFLGVNYYVSHLVTADPSDPYGGHRLPPAPPVTALGLGVDPDGLRRVLGRLRDDYPAVGLYVTENGAAFHDYVDPEGSVDDEERVSFLDGHLRAARAALDDGVDLRGYFVWSLLDNLEWTDGYSIRFGITYVDYRTQTRVPKASAHWYRALVARNGLP